VTPWGFLLDPALLRFLLGGLGLTLLVAVGAIVLGTALGTGLALLRLSPRPAVRLPALAYIEIVRSLPSFLVVVYVFFAAARLGLELSVPASVILGLALYAASGTAEIVRAGILSVERGQVEAARATGLSPRQAFVHVVVPQAARRMAPALASQFVTLTKSTSYGAVIGLHELLRRGVIVYSRYFNPVEVLLVVGVTYFVLCAGLSGLVGRLERAPEGRLPGPDAGGRATPE
jgi:His/Glu/Gln/Arg/opine family amino acid ABC transporter permease subunit